jgi:Cu(I)/Ag(I) efflux system membrane fusion protein
VNTTGQAVRRGEALLEVYSPDLVLAQREYLVARSAAADMAQADILARDNAKAIAAAALSRLKNWDISADQLARLQRTGVATRTLTLSAPIGGIVMEKPALQGLHFGVGAGDMLYRIVDLSAVWLLAELFRSPRGLSCCAGSRGHARHTRSPTSRPRGRRHRGCWRGWRS